MTFARIVRAIPAIRRTLDRDTERLATVLATLAATRRERDHAHLLLRALRRSGHIPAWPDPLGTAVNCAVSLESEGDIEDARRQADAWLASHNMPAPGHRL